MATTFANVKGKNVIMCVTSCVLFTVQIVISFLFLAGIVDYYGAAVTALGAVELLISIMNIAVGAIFEYLLKFMLGIVYIVATVIIIKNVISSISYFIHAAFDKGAKSVNLRESAFFALLDYVGGTVKACFMFMLLCVMTSVDFTVSDAGMAVLVMGVLCYVGSCGVMFYLRNLKLECILYRAGATVIMLVAYIFLVTKLQVASFEQLVYGLKVLFGGYLGGVSTQAVFSTITLIAVPILYMVLQFSILSYISDVWGIDFYLSSNPAIYASGKIMGVAIAVATVNLLVTMILNNMEAIGVTQMYKIVENELPMLIASIALFVCCRFEQFEEFRATSNVQPAPVQQVVAPTPAPAPVQQVVVPAPAPAPVVEEPAVTVVEPAPAPVQQVAEPAPAPKEEPKKAEPAHLNADVISELKQYKDLLDSGILTQEEFDAKKKELLGL